MRPPAGSDNIAVMRSRLVRLVLVTFTVCTAMACQTPNPEGAKKDAVDSKTPAKDTKAVEPAPTAVPTPTTAPTTAGTVTAPATAGGAGDPQRPEASVTVEA